MPPYGFIHKPSATWPVQSQLTHAIVTTGVDPPPIPGDTGEPKPSSTGGHVAEALSQEPLPHEKGTVETSMMVLTGTLESPDWMDSVNKEIDRAGGVEVESPTTMERPSSWPKLESPDSRRDSSEGHELKPPKVLMENPGDVPLELRSQIQIYATNE